MAGVMAIGVMAKSMAKASALERGIGAAAASIACWRREISGEEMAGLGVILK